MKMIKLYDGCRVLYDEETHEFIDEPIDKVWDFIKIPNDKSLRDDLFRNLFAFGKIDLSEAYHGHKMVIELIPTENPVVEEVDDEQQ